MRKAVIIESDMNDQVILSCIYFGWNILFQKMDSCYLDQKKFATKQNKFITNLAALNINDSFSHVSVLNLYQTSLSKRV